MEHGLPWHGKTLFQSALHVPMVMSGPGIPVGDDHRPVAQIDIVPTLVSILDLEWPGRLDGHDLFGSTDGGIPIFSSNLNATPLEVACVRVGDLKTVWEANSDAAFSFDLASDPGETIRLPADSAGLELVQLYWATPRAYTPMQVDREHVDQLLQGLGYI
jgi:arylsulfatase A-like enzyme